MAERYKVGVMFEICEHFPASETHSSDQTSGCFILTDLCKKVLHLSFQKYNGLISFQHKNVG